MTEAIFVGLDIGGTKTAVGLFDESGECVISCANPTPACADAEQLFPFFCATILRAFRKARISLDKLKGIGVGVPGAVNSRTGDILFVPNLHALKYVDLKSSLEEYFGTRVVIDNDANCGALAEYKYGAGRGAVNMAYVTASTGVGGGLILNGKLYRGSNGYAGEVGHVILDAKSDFICGSGDRGCAEALASGANFDKWVCEQRENGINTIMQSPVDGKEVARAFSQGDELAERLIKRSAGYIGMLMYNINTILDMDRFVLGGGLLHLCSGYIEDVRSAFNALSKVHADIAAAELKDNFGIIGAALLLKE